MQSFLAWAVLGPIIVAKGMVSAGTSYAWHINEPLEPLQAFGIANPSIPGYMNYMGM